MKKRGFGADKWNGFGGKVQDGETVEDAACRELREEAGIEAEELERMGRLEFSFAGKPELLEVHVFRVNSWRGEPQESEEMRPQWFSTDTLPFSSMWPDDRHWLPLFISGKKFSGRVDFGEDGDTIIGNTIRETEVL